MGLVSGILGGIGIGKAVSSVSKSATVSASSLPDTTKISAPTAPTTPEIVSAEQGMRKAASAKRGYLASIYGGETGGWSALSSGLTNGPQTQNKLG